MRACVRLRLRGGDVQDIVSSLASEKSADRFPRLATEATREALYLRARSGTLATESECVTVDCQYEVPRDGCPSYREMNVGTAGVLLAYPADTGARGQAQEIAQAEVMARWEEPAMRADWRKLTPLPRQTAVRLAYSREFTAQEMRRLRLGRIPLSMDDHWFEYMDREWFCAHRSWTGVCMLAYRIEESGGLWRITEGWGNTEAPAMVLLPQFSQVMLGAYCREATMFDGDEA